MSQTPHDNIIPPSIHIPGMISVSLTAPPDQPPIPFSIKVTPNKRQQLELSKGFERHFERDDGRIAPEAVLP